jgi:hypothetical protein
MKVYILTLIIFLSTSLFSQNIKSLKAHEDTLINLINKTRSETDFNKAFILNNDFEAHLRKVLRYDEAFSFPFDSLSKLISTVKSPDNMFRIFNWNIEKPKQEQFYCCLIMKYDTKNEEFITLKLIDKSASAFDPEYLSYSINNWYGALYYSIIPIKKAGGTIYTLLGWDGNNQFSNKKIIESMEFQKKVDIKFGLPIFKYDETKTKRRVIFQYNKNSYMSLKYAKDKKKELIIFDHLSPKSPQLEGMKDWYVTDLSFDAFKLENGKWNYIKNIAPQSLNSYKDRPYNNP